MHALLASWMVTIVAAGATPPKTILTILIDDLGSYDTAVNNPDIGWLTPTLAKLSHEEGLRLDRFYVNKFCSPTRRSYLTGRFPVSVSMIQAQPCDNTLPLEATILSEKLKQAPVPWANHFIGKGHLGYPTTDHLPINRGFDSHVGYLMGAENYVYGENENQKASHDCPKHMFGQCTFDFWHDHETGSSIHNEVFYSTNWYTSRAIGIIKNHTEHAPANQNLWVHLMYQGVHSPYVSSPEFERIPNDTQSASFWDPHPFGDMLRAVDTGIKNVTDAIRKTPGLWEETLIICTSDNGGIGPGNNYPLRGHKATPWEGGTKVMGFLTGGYLPASLRGKTHAGVVHVADWYPTICNLAGVADCTDNKTFLGKVRPIDGHDVWPLITSGASVGANHEWMPVTPDSLIYQERWKIIVNAGSTYWYTPQCGSSPPLESCCNTTCKKALHDQTGGDWPCHGKHPSPPGPPPAVPCTEDVPGFQCHATSYCGPQQSFYWTGAMDLEECGAACAANSTCHCFDFKDGPDSTTGKADCRLHVSASDITSSGAGYSAFVKSGSAATVAVSSREDYDAVNELVLAHENVGGEPYGASEPEAGCSVCTPEFPCLFDLVSTDPGGFPGIQERHNLASSQPALVKQLQAKLATYEAYFGTPIDPEVLAAKYDCPADLRPWYGNFSGPCCRPKYM